MIIEYCMDEKEIHEPSAWSECEYDGYFIEDAAKELVEEWHHQAAEYPDEDRIFLRAKGTNSWREYKIFAENERVYYSRLKRIINELGIEVSNNDNP